MVQDTDRMVTYQIHTFPKPDSPPCSTKSMGNASPGSSANDESALTTGNI
jgi:hypothetical protein